MAEAPTIHVDIVSAEGEIFSGPATEVFAPASQGEVGIWPRHAPLLSLLKVGEVRVKTPDGAEHFFFVGGGALEVQPTKVTVLAEDRKSTRLNSSHGYISYAVFCLKKKKQLAVGTTRHHPGTSGS